MPTRDQVRDWLLSDAAVEVASRAMLLQGFPDDEMDEEMVVDIQAALRALAVALPDFPDAPAIEKPTLPAGDLTGAINSLAQTLDAYDRASTTMQAELRPDVIEHARQVVAAAERATAPEEVPSDPSDVSKEERA